MDEEGPQRLRHLHHHKAPDRKQGLKQQEVRTQTVKTDPLKPGFCSHLEEEQIKNDSFSMHGEIAWTDTVMNKGGVRSRQSQRGWCVAVRSLWGWRHTQFKIFYYFFSV